MKPLDLVDCAKDLTKSKSGRPRQVNLRRATSSAYYALFHWICRESANMLIGKQAARETNRAWTQVYRSVKHGLAKKNCNNTIIRRFPQEIQEFALLFVEMQEKRHQADYDPNARLTKSGVMNDINKVETSIELIDGTTATHRRAFAAFMLLDIPPSLQPKGKHDRQSQ